MEINLCGAFNIMKGENMEVKETKKKNFSWIKELIIILLGILIAMAYALRTDAASLENEILIRYEEVYANNSFEDWNNTKKYTYSYSSPSEDSVNYFVVNGMDTNFYGVYIYSLEPIDIEVAITEVIEKNDGTIKEETDYEANYTDGKCYQKYTLSNGQDVYTYLISSYITNSFDFVKYYQDIFCDVYIVSDINQVQKNLENILVNGQVPDIEYEIPIEDIEAVGTYSEYIPTPKITVDNIGYGFGFNNAADDYYFELQGRWYSVDDIELFKENLQWKYKYSTLIKSSLSTWVTAKEKKLATDGYDFSDLGSDAFSEFLNTYPVDNRTYYGGTNAVGNYFSGYNESLTMLKMLLNEPTSLFNGLEVYIRYFTIDDDGNVNYGKWCHWYDALADAAGSSGSELDDKQNMHSESQSESGLTTSQKEDLEQSGNSKSDTDVITQYINNSPNEIASEKIWDVMESMISAMGSFPKLISTVFGWLPSWFINMIAVSLASLIILRFLGR